MNERYVSVVQQYSSVFERVLVNVEDDVWAVFAKTDDPIMCMELVWILDRSTETLTIPNGFGAVPPMIREVAFCALFPERHVTHGNGDWLWWKYPELAPQEIASAGEKYRD